MFTGIIEATGKIRELTRKQGNTVLCIDAPFSVSPGESVAVDGICLTVRQAVAGGFIADAVLETVERTTLKYRHPGDRVNLERALLPVSRLGGHLVTGHIDEIGRVLSVRTVSGSSRFEFGVSEAGSRLIVKQGSVAIDGISLTVAAVQGQRIVVNVIPFTLEQTTLRERRSGDRVNIEFDVIGKYVQRLIAHYDSA